MSNEINELPVRLTDYFFHSDFSANALALNAVKEGEIPTDIAMQLVSIMVEADNGPYKGLWNATPDSEYSLANATVVFNGRNSSSLPTKFIFDSVLVLEFSSTPVGRIYLQYNTGISRETPVKDNN